MKQNHDVPVHGEKHASYGIDKVDPDFPQALFKLSDNRHSDWPSDLNCFDFGSDHPLVIARDFGQPFAHRFVTRFRAIETNVQYWWNFAHGVSVPKMVRFATFGESSSGFAGFGAGCGGLFQVGMKSPALGRAWGYFFATSAFIEKPICTAVLADEVAVRMTLSTSAKGKLLDRGDLFRAGTFPFVDPSQIHEEVQVVVGAEDTQRTEIWLYPVTNGVLGQSSSDAGPILELISGQIDESMLGQELKGKIDGLQDQINALDGLKVYDPETAYTLGQMVVVDGRIYQALHDVPADPQGGNSPPNAALWIDVGQSIESANGLAQQVAATTAMTL